MADSLLKTSNFFNIKSPHEHTTTNNKENTTIDTLKITKLVNSVSEVYSEIFDNNSNYDLEKILEEHHIDKKVINEEDSFGDDDDDDDDENIKSSEVKVADKTIEDFIFWSENEDNNDGEIQNKIDKLTKMSSYKFVKVISKGAYGVVWLVKRKLTGDYYAMKITDYAEKVKFSK